VVTSRAAARGSGERLVAAAKALLNDAYGPRQQAIAPNADDTQGALSCII
jgi:hypothetical protein